AGPVGVGCGGCGGGVVRSGDLGEIRCCRTEDAAAAGRTREDWRGPSGAAGRSDGNRHRPRRSG
ncbi:hypothetical protein ACSG5Z_31085, partial [Bacillus sp. 'calajunan']